MTATCRCGVMVTAELDGILDNEREQRMQNRLAAQLVEHLNRAHPEEMHRAGLFASQMASWMILAQFSSTDPKFAEWREAGRKNLADALDPATPLSPLTGPTSKKKVVLA